MPDLDELTGFDPGLGGPMLPPSEIRRRGDRRRRRTTTLAVAGAALAAAVVVGAPVAVLSGGDDGRRIQPAPSPPAPSTGTDRVTTVPAEFPLTAGFPTPAEKPQHPDSQLTPNCGTWFTGAFADDAVASYTGESEDQAQRWLVLFDDQQAAKSSLAQAREAVDQCPAEGISSGPRNGVTLVYATVPVDLGTEESFAWTQQVLHDDGLVSDLTYVQVARTGNALYVESSFGAVGGDQAVAAESQRLLENATAPLQSMCLFAEHPCVIEGEPAVPSSTADDIPDDFPLGLGFEIGPDESVTGPASTLNGVSFSDLCQTDAWPGTGSTDRLAVRVQGIEYSGTRELVTYETDEQASAVVTALSDAVAACPRDQDRRFETLHADTGYPSSVTFGFTYRVGLGGALFQVVRVGRAVLATVETGEYSADSLTAGVPTLTDDNRQLTDLMRCSWTVDGC